MKTLNNEFWRLRLEVKFVRARHDIYEPAPCTCGCWSKFCQLEEDKCTKCHGTGTMMKIVPYPKAPEIPESLMKHMEQAYKQFLEESE